MRGSQLIGLSLITRALDMREAVSGKLFDGGMQRVHAILVVLNTHTFVPFHTPAVGAMADKRRGAQHADAICPASWTAPYSYLIAKVARLAVGYLRDPGIWLMKRRGRHSLCRRCNGED